MDALPVELLHSILDHLPPTDLKALRLTNRTLEIYAAAQLFSHFALYCHERSFERLAKVAAHKKLRHFVTALYYDGRFIDVNRHILNRLQWVWSGTISAEEQTSLTAKGQLLYDQRLETSSIIDIARQTAWLMAAMPRLSSLSYIGAHDTHPTSVHSEIHKAQLPDFYTKMLKETCERYPHSSFTDEPLRLLHPYRESYSHLMLYAMRFAVKPIKILELSDIDFTDFEFRGLEKQTRDLAPVLASLESLTILNNFATYMTGADALRNLQAILQPAMNLTDLCLVLRDTGRTALVNFPLFDGASEQTIMSMFASYPPDMMERRISKRLIYSSKLAKLQLGGIVCSGSEIREVLRPCRPALRELKLCGLILLPDLPSSSHYLTKAPRTCLVAFFKWLREKLSLAEFKVTGTVTNTGMQTWEFRPGSSDTNTSCSTRGIAGQLREFVLHRIDVCPVDKFAVQEGYFDLRRKEWQSQAPIRAMEEEGMVGDDTFIIRYGHLEHEDIPETDYEDDDEDYDGGSIDGLDEFVGW